MDKNKVFLKCDCISNMAKWTLVGVLNTMEIITNSNHLALMELVKGREREPFERMALSHLEDDLIGIKALKSQLRDIKTCD